MSPRGGGRDTMIRKLTNTSMFVVVNSQGHVCCVLV